MNARGYLLPTAVLTALLASGAMAAQPPAGTEPPASAVRETVLAAEDIAVARALAPLQLSHSQLAQLLPALQDVQTKLIDSDQKEQAKLANYLTMLEQARRDLLAGKGTGTRAQDQFDQARTTSAQRHAGRRGEMVSSLRRVLATILDGSQVAQVAERGQAVLLTQRVAGWGGMGRGGGGGIGGGRGSGGQGGSSSGNPMFDRLDRIRTMSPAEFQDFTQRRGGRGGGQDPQAAERNTALLNQIRTLPQSQYLLQREQLTAQMMGGRGGFGAANATDAETASNAFVDRYLLSPRAPVVVRDLLQSP